MAAAEGSHPHQMEQSDQVPRTLLEELIRARTATLAELCDEFHQVARELGESATLSTRHLQRLASGARTGAMPTTRRVLETMWDESFTRLVGPPQAARLTVPTELGRLACQVTLNTATNAIHRTFASSVDAAGSVALADMTLQTLEQRVLDAWQHGLTAQAKPLLTLVGGFAGSGKSEFGRFLSSVTGWTLLDKDTLTRPFAENLLVALGGDPNDRQTALYREQVRPLEYRSLLAAAFENLGCGISTVATAPFIAEITDSGWLERLANRCGAGGADLAVVWVECDAESMHEYISMRGAARDAWKLSCWPEYVASIDLSLRPVCGHQVVDNRLNKTVSLAEQAREVAHRVQR